MSLVVRTSLCFAAVLVASCCCLLVVAGGENPHQHAADAMPNVAAIRFAVEDQMSLSVSPSVLSGLSSYVSINWTSNTGAMAGDWIAAYSPVPTSQQGYLDVLPVKYVNLTAEDVASGAQGSINTWLLHMRAPWIMAYMRGSLESPTIVALSQVVTYTPETANMPMQIRLARTVDPTQMQVSWITTDAPTPVVKFFPTAGGDVVTVAANTSTYTRDQMCGGLAAGIGWRDPGAIHTALLTGLVVGSEEYSYTVGDLSSGIFSDPMTFYSAPLAGKDIDLIIFGDHGQAEFDGSIEWAEHPVVEGHVHLDIDQPAAINTSLAVTRDLVDGTIGLDRGALVLIIGDVSYARGREAVWDQHSFLIQPFSTKVPVMTLLGNHEFDWKVEGNYWGGTDSGGECGVPLQSRFPMPSPPSSFQRVRENPGADESPKTEGFSATPWYSFDHGAVHFVMMSSEHDFSPKSEQHAWLAADLASVDRTVTPWILMSSHRPMYVSSTDNVKPSSDMVVAALLRRDIEPLIQQYRVDAFFAGHHHDYQRSCPVFNETCAVDAGVDMESGTPTFGTVHTVTGAAGQWCNVFLDPSTLPWLEFANTQVHGYTRVRVRGSNLTLDFVGSNDREVYDSVTITQQPQGKAPIVTKNPSRTYQPERVETA